MVFREYTIIFLSIDMKNVSLLQVFQVLFNAVIVHEVLRYFIVRKYNSLIKSCDL